MHKAIALGLMAYCSAQAQTITETFGNGANQFQIEFVTIGNPGNSPNSIPAYSYRPAYTAGSVSYVFNLGKHEINRGMIEKANNENGLGITLEDMSNYGGNLPAKPASGVSWNEAARFVNWLNTSKGYQAAYNFTSSGLNDHINLWSESESALGGDGKINRFRHKNAQFFLPSIDEWFKGAYGSPNGKWYRFPTGSDTDLIPVNEGVLSGTAVYNNSSGPADITNAGGLSAFGTMAQGGNVVEWVETASDGENDLPQEMRQTRGGFYGSDGFSLLDLALFWNVGPSSEYIEVGFRVAMVPEPSSVSLLLVGGAVLMAGRQRSQR